MCYRCDKLIAIYIVTCKGPKIDIEWLDIIMFLSKILNQMSRNYPITRKCVFFWMKLQNCKHACSNRTTPFYSLSLDKISYQSVCCIRRFATNHQTFNEKRIENTALHSNLAETKEQIAARHQLKLDEAVNTIYGECTKKDVMIQSFGTEHIRSCLIYLTDMNLHIKEVQELMILSPKIFVSQNLQSTTEFLREYGFSPKQVASIFKCFPDILDMDFTVISKLLESLRKLGFYDVQLLKLVSYNPDIISLRTEEIVSRVNELKALFKSRDILNLIAKSPFILTEDIAQIHSKFNYIFSEMGITQRQMMYCNLFSHSLGHIRTRHQFLMRAGLYKKVAKDKGEINKNPLLQDILDRNDAEFARKYGNMSELEFHTFGKMFEKEMENIDQDDIFVDFDN